MIRLAASAIVIMFRKTQHTNERTGKSTTSSLYTMPSSSITCRECGEDHLTIRCPLRSPTKRARSLTEIRTSQMAAEEAKPFHCKVFSRPGKAPHNVVSETVEEFRDDIQFAQDHSIYGDFSGIVSIPENILYPRGFPNVSPGKYTGHWPNDCSFRRGPAPYT